MFPGTVAPTRPPSRFRPWERSSSSWTKRDPPRPLVRHGKDPMQTSSIADPRAVFRTPQWVQDAVFYQIFSDRFASSPAVPKPGNLEPWDSPPTTHGFKGGDLLGIVDHLDYLQDLGITAI